MNKRKKSIANLTLMTVFTNYLTLGAFIKHTSGRRNFSGKVFYFKSHVSNS